MARDITSISIFGLDNVLVTPQDGKSIMDCKPNKVVGSTFRNSVGDKNSVTNVISSQDQSKHTETWRWLQTHFKVVGGPRPTYLLMRIGALPAVVSAVQNLQAMLSTYPNCTRIECTDHDEILLSSYRDFIKSRNILFWQLNRVTETAITTFDSSFVKTA